MGFNPQSIENHPLPSGKRLHTELEACRQSALLLGVCQAATAAANMAQNVP